MICRVQSLLFERPLWSAVKARAWASKQGFKTEKVHVTEKHLRLRQSAPVPGRAKRTIVFGRGIKAVIEEI